MLENILFPDFSKSRSLVLTQVFFILVHFLLRSMSQTDKPAWPLWFPRAQSSGDHPLTPRPAEGRGPLTIMLPLCFLQHIWSNQHLDQAACLQAKPWFPLYSGKHTWVALRCLLLLQQLGKKDSLQQLLTALAYCLHVKASRYFWDSH